MKILFVSRAYGPHGGGMERLSWELIHAIQKQPNVAATVVATSRTLSLPLWANRLLSVFALVPLGVRALRHAPRVDVIHLGDPLLSKIGWLAKLIWRKPVAVTVHGLDVSYPNPIYRLYLKLFFCNLNLYLPISSAAKKKLDRWNVKGKVTTITPGIHDRFYDPSLTREDLKKLLHDTTHYSLQPTHSVLLTVGRLIRRKGHAWFIESVLPRLPRNVVYVIAGDGPDRTAIQQAAKRVRCENRVVLLGSVRDEHLNILYNTVHAYIQPNIHVGGDVEGFGIVMLEAALCERPVFAANIDGISDAIHGGNNGTLIESMDADEWARTLNTFFTSPQPRSEARQYTLNQFSWVRKATDYLTQLQMVASRQ